MNTPPKSVHLPDLRAQIDPTPSNQFNPGREACFMLANERIDKRTVDLVAGSPAVPIGCARRLSPGRLRPRCFTSTATVLTARSHESRYRALSLEASVANTSTVAIGGPHGV